jgi:hypothetical protein
LEDDDMYIYKDGMRFIAEDRAKTKGFHTTNSIHKIGKNVKRTIKIKIEDRLSAGAPLLFQTKLQKVYSVKLNGYTLTPRMDYSIRNNEAVAFTFNLVATDKIEIEGLT